MSYRIIRSSGIQRGKSDKIDALRIACYAEKHQEKAQLFRPQSQTIIQIKALMGLRDKLIRHKNALLKPANELEQYDKAVSKLLRKHQAKTLNAIAKDLLQIEEKIQRILQEDDNFKALFKLVCSVPGVGPVTAIHLLCYTNAFQNFQSPRQLACYCGVAPFEYTSGKSIKSRPRVHHMANKQLKQLLHMGALSAIRSDPDLKAYKTREKQNVGG